ncbi:MAG: NUDIX hydrolase [Aquirufa sp.]
MIHEKFIDLLTIQQEILVDSTIKNNAKEAAVLVIINQISGEEDKVIVIKRNEYDGPHSGQIALPGGKKDPTDIDLVETAYREVEEELGLDLRNFVLKPINPHWVIVSNFWVQPYFTIVNKKLEFNLNKREINRIFEIPVSFLQDVGNLQAHQINILKKNYWAPLFKYDNEIIWGATAIFLYELFHLKKDSIYK